jgi:hypothetical protein
MAMWVAVALRGSALRAERLRVTNRGCGFAQRRNHPYV